MSAKLELLQKQISSGEDLSSIVRTMKALAATSVRQYEKAAESLDDYYGTVALGLTVVLSEGLNDIPTSIKPRSPIELFVVIGSDYGLAGRFNEQIVSYALHKYAINSTQDSTREDGKEEREKYLICVGEQVINRVVAEGIEPDVKYNVPGSISAITPLIQQLLESIEYFQANKGVESVLLIYNRPEAAGFKSISEMMLPVDYTRLQRDKVKWESRSLPLYTLPVEKLLSSLLRQYFFVSLYRACALSLAAENAARLAAMQSAEKNIDERLSQLRTGYQHERQAAITEELLDVISGFKALKK